jgi:uncharacterized protein (DUF1800 family)
MLAVGLLSACDNGSSPNSQASAPLAASMTRAEAFRFLNQATMGATVDDADRLVDIGIPAWIQDQLNQPASLELPYIQSLPRPSGISDLHDDRVDIWFKNALRGPDQLRQRVAFALSEIFVVSEVGALHFAPYSVASYYDLLSTSAFGNFRDLLKAVTLHPAMGVYLSSIGNQKSDPARNVRPDENYAREVMQLFTIGLVELANDGSVKTDEHGQPIPTYNQDVVKGFAKVFTGWNYAGAPTFASATQTDDDQVVPMQLYPSFHDPGSKLLLRGVTLPAGGTGDQDLDAALDSIFMHPNVGPFIARRLIQRLVTSNPSPAYIGRIASTFNDDGHGVRGNLAAVVTAILLDAEARPAAPKPTDGKAKEPLLRLTELWRAYGARSANNGYKVSDPYAISIALGEGPVQSPSVFNFFSPFFGPPGNIRNAGLVAPELEIATEFQNTMVTNAFAAQAFLRNSQVKGLAPDDVVIDIDTEVTHATDPPGLIEDVDEKLLGGTMSTTLRSQLEVLVASIPATDSVSRAAEAVYFVAASPEFAVQR